MCVSFHLREHIAYLLENPVLAFPRPNRTLVGTNCKVDMALERSAMAVSTVSSAAGVVVVVLSVSCGLFPVSRSSIVD